MQGSPFGWWRRHGWTVAILLSAIGISFAIRTIWTYPIIQQFGPLYSYAGGSDSYYHSRVTTYIILNHRNLVFDPLIHFPIGGYNPREPLFDWMNAILGLVFAPFFGGNAVTAGGWFLDLQAPLWAALGVVPVYLIGREVSSKRVGLIAAMIFPFLSANIDSSIFGYANYLSFYTFVILVTVYSYIRTVKAVGSRRWIENYRRPSEYLPGVRGFLRTERTAVKWAVFTGVSLGALALAWQGYTYAIVVIGVSLVITMIVERFRRVDSFGLYVSVWIIGLIAFPMAVPYYLVQHQFASWFDLPLLLFFGTLALMTPFLVMRDIPWVFSIPTLVGLVGAAALFLAVFEPVYFHNIVTGQGYFVKSLIYSTVAEAQAPSIDELVVGYGVITFFLAFAGLAIFVYTMVRGRFKRHHVVYVVFAVLSIYLPISAAKFFLLGSPAFALLPSEAIDRALQVGSYPTLRRTVVSLSDRRSQFSAFRKAFKARHVLILLLILAIILPNVWVGIDAGIPSNTKNGFSAQVYDSLPSFLKGNSSTIDNYFGAAGTSIDTSNQYDSAGYNWLATQDTNLPESQRPAMISWWDYGFQTIDQGQHPSVADNFQNGIDPAGQFLLAQNESIAIGVLAVTLLQAEQKATGLPYLPAELNTRLAAAGLNVSRLHNYLVNESYDYALVVANPNTYGPVDSSTITLDNAMFLAASYYIARALPLSGVSDVYDVIQGYTGWSIKYDLTDSRLIPFSGTDTGIYYAPADLTGRVINAAGLPTSYFNVTVLGSDGNYYPLGDVPADVSAVQYYVNYFAPFYNSMIYRTYFGYNGTDIGESVGIPGLEGSVVNSPIEPGWMLQHFQVVYQTAYYCGNATEAISNPSCFTAMNKPTAVALANSTGGVANTSAALYFGGGESMLEYYPGQTLLGQIQLSDGTPVGGLRATVYDQWGIPHETTITATDGSFSLVLPPGNDTVNITTGTLEGLTQEGNVPIKSLKIDVPAATGFSLNSPNLPMTITVGSGQVGGYVYWNSANSTSYEPSEDALVSGAQIVLWGPNNVSRLTTTTDASGAFQLANVPPGVYHYDVLVNGQNYTQSSLEVTSAPSTVVNATTGLPTGVVKGTVLSPSGSPEPNAVVTLGGSAGAVGRNLTNSSGGFRISGYATGNYTLLATLPGTDLQSAGTPVAIANFTSSFTGNLTLRPVVATSITVTANGAPQAGIPVQVVPIASFANSSVAPVGALERATANATVVVTGTNGVATIGLPYGNYSLAAVGFVGSTLSAGTGVLIASSAATAASTSLSLSPAIALTGTVASAGPGGSETDTAVVAYGPDGSSTIAWTVNGTYRFYLPAGAYSVLALQGDPTSTSTTYAALAAVSLTSATSLSLSPVSAIAARFTVGTPLGSGGVVPAAGATVTISAGSTGASVTVRASASGVAGAYLPSTVPAPSTTYCVAATSPGFVAASTCNLSPNSLSSLTQFPLALSPVALTVTVLGGPAGSTVVNVTGTTSGAPSRVLTGGPTLTTTVTAGSFNVTAWSPTGNVSAIYRQTAAAPFSVAFGATAAAVTVRVALQVNTTGTLSLPSGATAAKATIAFSSATFNSTINGTAYTKTGFYAPAGTYSALAKVSVANTTYSGLQFVTVAVGGKATGTLAILNATSSLTGTLESRNGTTLSVATTVRLTATSGPSLLVAATAGVFTASVPVGTTFGVAAAVTTTVSGSFGPYDLSWVSTPGTTCSVSTASTAACTVPMVSTAQLVWLNGTLSSSGVPDLVSGSVRITGPSPSVGITTVAATNGTFSVQLLPGTYSLYAAGGGGSSPLATLTSVAVSLTTPSTVALALYPTWTVTLVATAPSGAPLLGATNVSIANAQGASVVFPGVAAGTSVMIALPLGTYTAHAASYGAPYGRTSDATANQTVVVLRGNVAAVLALTYVYAYTASLTIVGTTSATIAAPGTTTFAFSVRATGNAPIAIHPVGTPATWGFVFSFSNATLTPGGALLSASVTIQVPADASAVHPAVEIEVALGNGTVIASASPTVTLTPTYGVTIGPLPSSPAEVASTGVSVFFYVTNTGNAIESVRLSLVDPMRVSSLGWRATFRSTSAALGSNTTSLAAFENQTVIVQLNATQPIFVPVGYVTVQASVTNVSGAYQSSSEIPVPVATVNPKTSNGSAPVTVTGPSLTGPPSSLPDWVIPLASFVPVIALVVGVLTVRWWRTRRWSRR